MRILHTSDWHLGRSFHRADLLEHQAAYLDHLLEVVESEAVDLVVVAGDVYDRALPPVDAVRLADQTLARLAASRARTVITSGNHDSARRLGFGAALMDAAGVHVRADIAGVGTPVLVPDDHGEVAVYGLPYLDPDAARTAWSLGARSHEAALGAAMQRVRTDLAARSARTRTRSVVLAHAFVAGAQPSASERDIAVGGVDRVPTSVFDGIDYAALGHLHAPHELAPHLRYSGSPLAYSFSETSAKGSWLVDLAADGGVRAEFVAAPVPRALVRMRGRLDDLLHDDALRGAESGWVHATLTDPVRPHAPMERLRARFPHTLVLAFEPEGRGPAAVLRPVAAGRGAHDVTLDFVADVRGAGADAAESALLQQACEACSGDTSDPSARSSADGEAG